MPMMRDGVSGDWIGTWSGHKGAVWSCQVDPSGSLAATASGDFSARVWDAITGASLVEFPHKHIVKTCAFSPNSELLTTGGKEGILRVFGLKEALDPKNKTTAPLAGHKQADAITKVCWLDNERILAGMANGRIALLDALAGRLDYTFVANDGEEVRDMEVSKDGRILSVAAGKTVTFFDIESKNLLHKWTMPIHFRDEGGVTLHPSGTKFVAGGSDLWVRVFDFATGKELECHKGHHGPIRCVRYSPDGSIYASGSEDGTIRLWKTNPEK
eukprot:CAMPEP_0119562136 /NCGR_PEP_ID=MMETSP1352-20130426/19551_1 /TAXON_ID=265584 /ORGANISM="Stauroneis constricta, Strain CCMP1120" /LENGTH=270 /DNA_ID=CAMNT_0007610483 /DNA_START=87 /DNA_END=899 /DNA_ORIENTATION=-